MIEFKKKPVHIFNGQEFDTLESAQIAAIEDLDPSFKMPDSQLALQILKNAAALSEIFKETPRKNASPAKKKRAPKIIAPTT